MTPAHYLRTLLWPPALTLLLAGCLPPLPEGGDDADGDGVEASIDCDDDDPEVGAGESWYLDADEDSYGDPDAPSAQLVCPGTSGPEGYLPEGTDCDDHDDTINPSAPEVWYDGIDQDCDGHDDDQDYDGSAAIEVGGDDCDDTDASVKPGATEVWYDGTDQDCDGNDCDQDGDGYCSSDYAFAIPEGYEAGDCDDADIAWNPGADESDCTDANDYNCDGSTGYADDDGDGVPACEECDDTSAASYPGAIEACDGVDNDCDGTTDVGASDVVTWYADVDGDGFGDAATALVACSGPDDGATWVIDGTDCDDADPLFHPGADESDCADANDYNCDGSVGYDDVDGDGSAACEDCDDGNRDAFPGGVEVCDSADNDCDGTVDVGATDAPTWFADADLDTFGDPATATVSCAAPATFIADDSDCDDTNRDINPDAIEVCDYADNDCDTTTDVNALDASAWYADTDGDTFGDATDTQDACVQPLDYVSDDTDCDDSDASSFPGGTEVCDLADNDCDGTPDDSAADAPGWYADTDSDTFGDASDTRDACEQPGGYVSDSSDCDDTDDTSWPGADEYCDGIDHDCDRLVDEDDSVDATLWYEDVDGDTFGTSSGAVEACAQPFGYVVEDTDCDDATLNVYPGAPEACNGRDDDCDTLIDDDDILDPSEGTPFYADADGDGHGDPDVTSTRCVGTLDWLADDSDCDDTHADVFAGADEVCDELDNDCDGATDDDSSYFTDWYADADRDGFGDASASTAACSAPAGDVSDGTDCDDADASLYADADGDGVCDTATLAADYATLWGSEMILLPAGTFTMGGGAGDPDGEYTDHEVTLTHDFWIGATEVTHAQWESDPTYPSSGYTSFACTGTTAACPADALSWYDVAKYCNALSAAEGLTSCYTSDGTDLSATYLTDPYSCPGYRMPTEAEWEYAARAGEATEWSGSATAADVAWTDETAYSLGTNSHEVATLAANAWGLYDMSGNHREWTDDWYSSSYGGYGTGIASTDPPGPSSGSTRVVRGGYFYGYIADAAVSARDDEPPSPRSMSYGFRLARTSTSSPPTTPTVAITPTSPADSDDLVCTGSGSIDPDGDTVSYSYTWAVDGTDAGVTTDTVPASSTSAGEVWTCSVTASDGTATSAAGTASVTIAAPAVDYTTVWGSEMILLPAGTFTMGGGAGDPDGTYTDHEVTLTHDFWMGETEVTQAQYALFTTAADPTPSYFGGYADRPVEMVSWYEVAKYANALSTAEGLTPCYLTDGTELAAAYLTDPYSCPGYRLPTEAEWEYAARAGEDMTYAGSSTIGDVAWYATNSGGMTHSACGLTANAWGLCDMSGNVWEWTGDWYSSSYDGYGTGSGTTDPPGPTSGSDRVVRGGAWTLGASYATVSGRDGVAPPYYVFGDIGFRLSRSIP